jgi:hypothetical protein
MQQLADAALVDSAASAALVDQLGITSAYRLSQRAARQDCRRHGGS